MAEDSTASTRVGDSPAHRDRIIERLVNYGIPMHQFGGTAYGLVAFVGRNKSILPDVVYALLPTEEDISNSKISSKMDNRRRPPKASMNALFAESFLWIQWLMFKKEPQSFLKNLEESCAGHRAVCGAVWGSRNLAYKCRTCQHDPTCAICVPCFQNGNHDGHDISIIYVSGGCCDCGDASAWKPQGFCSKHGGLENIQPLSPEIADSLGPVLEALFHIWNDKLSAVQRNICVGIHNKVENALSNAIAELLLEFCSCSESLLSFTSAIMCGSIGLLDLLIRSELFLVRRVCQKIHDLLLKLLAEPRFKKVFAKAFIKYYEYIIHEDIKKNDSSNHEQYPLILGLSVQIFTVPTLTLLLVQENNLLGVLFGCLEDLLVSCTSGHSCLQMNKWINLYQATINLVSNIIYVVRDKEVCKYIANKQPDVYRAWFRILSLVQGMEPQIRVTNHHSEDQIEDHDASNDLRKYLGKVQKSLIEGAVFSFTSCADNLNDGFVNNTEIKTIFQNNSKCFSSQMSSKLQVLTEHVNTYPILSSTVKLLISECLEAIENWLSKGTTVRIYLPVIHDVNKKNNLHNLEKGFLRKPTSSDSTTKLAMHHECCKHECPITTGEPSAICKKQKGENLPCSSNSSLKKVAEIDNEGLVEGQSTLGTAVWPDIVYDVSSQEVSFHIPMHRFLCVLLQRTMEFCYGGSGGIETTGGISAAASHRCQFFENVLDGFHMDAVSAYLMEHPLSLRVYCAQVHAGMWRKNGETSVYLAEHYRSVHGCQSGIEIDLFLLQCCAALAPPDLFVTRILERFGLSRYLSLDTSGKNEYESTLLQEMLSLIIQIVKERRYCGFSIEENLQRELLNKLAIGDATRSQLVDALPHDLSKNDQLQKVLDTLAVYVKPSAKKQGKYTLRHEYWKCLDLYHPRWNSRHLQIAEERYAQFCMVSPLNVQLPLWTRIISPLKTISRIATSETVLKIVRAVIYKAVFTEMPLVSSVSDGVVAALHLLALSLDICEKQKSVCVSGTDALPNTSHFCHPDLEGSSFLEGSFPVLSLATERITHDINIQKPQSLISMLILLMRRYRKENYLKHPDISLCNISSLIECLLKKYGQLHSASMDELKQLAPDIFSHSQPYHSSSVKQRADTSEVDERKVKARAHQAAVLEKMRAEQLKFVSSLESTSNCNLGLPRSLKENSEDSAPVCSLCREPQDTNSERRLWFLVHVQKSRLLNLLDNGPRMWGSTCKEHQSVLNDTSLTSDSIPRTDSSLFGLASGLLNKALFRWGTNMFQLPNSSRETEMNHYVSLATLENDSYSSIQQHIQQASHYGPDLVGEGFKYLLSIVNEVSKNKENTPASIFDEVLRCSFGEISMPSSMKCAPHVFHAMSCSSTSNVNDQHPHVDFDGIHVSSCGHAVHKECYTRYLSSLKQRNIRRMGYEGRHIADPHKDELLCPVCRGFSNSILPDMADVYYKSWKLSVSAKCNSACCSCFSKKPGSAYGSSHLCHALSLLQGAAKTLENGEYLADMYKNNITLEIDFGPVVKKLCTMHHGHGEIVECSELNLSSVLWDSLRYSLVSCEISARGKTGISSEDSISSINSLYEELDTSTGCTLSRLMLVSQVARSLDYFHLLLRYEGIKHFANSVCYGVSSGFSSSTPNHVIWGEVVPCDLFWKFAADPVLAHDPFTALMWLLFSLPTPFLSSAESFVSLVHLFYVVSVIQALITCHSTQRFSSSCFSASTLNEFCRTMGELDVFKKYFISNYIDYSSSLRDMIHRLTIPFLRRCALLWKLVLSVSSACDHGDCHLKSQPFCYASKVYGTDKDLQSDLQEATKLENIFKLCSLDVIICDETVQSLAFNWCKHFYQTIGAEKPGWVLFSSPAVPFKLMPLPLLYQELLQRYIEQKCPDCTSIICNPALCLMCGKLCSWYPRSCCRPNQCGSHSLACGAGIGVFLLLERTAVLLQRSARQTFWSSPYLDAYGEEDLDLCRGRPLYLNNERYAALANLVSSHSLDRSSEILSNTSVVLHNSD